MTPSTSASFTSLPGRSARRCLVLLAFALLPAGLRAASGQVVVSPPGPITLAMVAGGLPPARTIIRISDAGGNPVAWTAEVDPAARQWLSLSPAASTAENPAPSLALTCGARPPGEYAAAIVITPATSTPLTVRVNFTVVPAAPPPVFTYPAGPHHCTQPPGYPDQATCTVPGETPPGAFTPPKPGGSYLDPNFGARVTILTEPGYRHAYSSPSPVSANGKYVLVFDRGNWLRVIEASSGRVVEDRVPGNPNTGIFWDATDDAVYYFFHQGEVRKYQLAKRKVTTVYNYAADPAYGFDRITAGGTGDMSKDNWLAFVAPSRKTICALDLNTVATYCAAYDSIPGPPVGFVDFPLMSRGKNAPSGKRYVLLMANPALAVFSIDTSSKALRFEFRGPENPEGNGNRDGICDRGESCLGAPHADVFEDADGVQYLVTLADTNHPCERALVTMRLDREHNMRKPAELGGGLRRVMPVFKCGAGIWTSFHVGCARAAPFCVVSTTYFDKIDPAASAPIRRTPHLSEIFVMKGNGTEIRRLAQHRSLFFKNIPNEQDEFYWSTPRAAISADGSLVVAGSNFGVPRGQRVFSVETGWGRFR